LPALFFVGFGNDVPECGISSGFTSSEAFSRSGVEYKFPHDNHEAAFR